MAIDASFVGRSYPATEPYLVGREKIREFATAIGVTSPVCHDPVAAQALGYADVVAPPTFAVVVTMKAGNTVTFDPDLGLDYSRVVHGEQSFRYTRPIVAGDELAVSVTVESIRSVAGNDILGLRADVTDASGDPILSARSVVVARGRAGS
ncbi:MAG: MaoC family dehydratase N-terminal domain-containing protein [bacterium]